MENYERMVFKERPKETPIYNTLLGKKPIIVTENECPGKYVEIQCDHTVDKRWECFRREVRVDIVTC